MMFATALVWALVSANFGRSSDAFGHPTDSVVITIHTSKQDCEAAKAQSLSDAVTCLGPYEKDSE